MWPSFEAAFALAEPLIKTAESFQALPYLCPAGKWTIGWGTTHYPDGRAVAAGDVPISEVEGQVFLEAHCKAVYAQLQQPRLIVRVPTVHQAAALMSLAYNIGVGTHDGVKGDLADSTLLARFNAGELEGAADQFLVWNKAHDRGGNVITLNGLNKRRGAERALFLTADQPASAGASIPITGA